MPSASRAAGTRPARRTAVSAWASAISMSSASRKAATITRCCATPSAFSLLRVRSCWWTERSSSLPVTPSGIRGSGSRGPFGARRGPPRSHGRPDDRMVRPGVRRTVARRALPGAPPRRSPLRPEPPLPPARAESAPSRPGRPAAAGAHRHRTHRSGDPRLRDDRCSPRARHQLLGLCCRFGRPARRVTVAQCTDARHRGWAGGAILGSHDRRWRKGPPK